MILTLANNRQIRGDLIKSATLRSTLAPIPSIFEAIIRIDEELKKLLAEGQTLTVESDLFYIVKDSKLPAREMQGDHANDYIKIIACLNAVRTISYVRQTAIIKENTALSTIYRAAGADLKAIDTDFIVPRFSCFVGNCPSFGIAQALQEEGGLVRWKNGKLIFVRLQDFFKQKPVLSVQESALKRVNSGFIERFEIPSFYSLDENGAVITGNTDKTRTVKFIPNTNALRLQNMSRCLVRQATTKVSFDMRLTAGDLIDVAGSKPLVVLTAGHLYSAENQYTKLWLAGLKN